MRTVERYASSVINLRIDTKVLIFIVVVVSVTVSFASQVTAVQWLSVHQGKNIPWNDTKACKAVKKQYCLTKQQTTLCKKSADIMPHVQEAANLVVSTCELLLRKRLWNCSSLRKLPEIKADLEFGTKERALVHAMSTAALTFTVSRGCSRSSISSCGCSAHPEDPPGDNFKWGGCGDNFQYAAQFSKQFDTKKKTKPSKRTAMKRLKYSNYQNDQPQLTIKHQNTNEDANEVSSLEQNTSLLEEVHNHNGEIGRNLVSNSLSVQCKCHGVSGSCSIKTCWRGLPVKFNIIGEKVVAAYNRAVQVHELSKAHIVSRYKDEQCLIYTANSPNYCEYNPKAGFYGTSGRECNANSSSNDVIENCETMCCGRGYQTRNLEYYEKCNCQYHPEIYNVKCDKCKKIRTINTCN